MFSLLYFFGTWVRLTLNNEIAERGANQIQSHNEGSEDVYCEHDSEAREVFDLDQTRARDAAVRRIVRGTGKIRATKG